MLAGLLELVASRKKDKKWDDAVALSFLLGGIGGVAAAVCGWSLAAEGGYDPATLSWHRWLGIISSGLGFTAWLVKSGRLKLSRNIWLGIVGVCFLGITITGHLGGNLTHGENYLYQYAPGIVQALVGYEPDTAATRDFSSPDSILIYTDLIQPVLEQKCYSCHSDAKSQGGLNMATLVGLMEGGEHGEVITAGDALGSEMVRRVTINPTSSKYMPTKGAPMTFTEINLLSWWIDAGADSSLHLTDEEVPDHIKALLMRDYKLDTRPKPYVETAHTSPINDDTRKVLEDAGFSVSVLAANSNFVEVGPKTIRGQMNSDQIALLPQAKDQITWLNLGNAGLKDDDLKAIGELKELTRLRLENNALTDAGIAHLDGLPHLESLNVYATGITDAALDVIARLPNLKRVYLWQTQVSEQGIEALRAKRPGMMIDTGFQFAAQTEQAEQTE
ncbi:MAG: hypothetical protein KDD15_23850 [Lewinella sp.]|nr:hypothetical protein [Lewinella sp.]